MLITPCGAYCKNCIVYKKKCKGCNGRPFYLKGEICPVFKCAKERKIAHCGLCKDFPCETFLSHYDPKRGIVTALRRAGLLVLRKKIGDRKWKNWVEKNKIKFGV